MIYSKQIEIIRGALTQLAGGAREHRVFARLIPFLFKRTANLCGGQIPELFSQALSQELHHGIPVDTLHCLIADHYVFPFGCRFIHGRCSKNRFD